MSIATHAGDAAPPSEGALSPVSFDAHPDSYRHWRLEIEGEVARLVLDVDEAGGIVPGYPLKLNSYDLGVDIELHDAVQRLRFEHPEVRAVVLTGGRERVFCAGANIRMLAQSTHPWKVNFCKFTNETRNGIEDATEHSGQTYIAALNGTASGGGYELALACDRILLVDDGASAVSLPELPLLGVLPGTGGLTRLVDKRRVRRDLADVVATRAEGVRGQTAVAWRLVDEAVPRGRFEDVVRARAAEAAARSTRPAGATGVTLTPLRRTVTDSAIVYPHVRADLDREAGSVDIAVSGPSGAAPEGLEAIHRAGAGFWPLAVSRELDDLVLRLRTNELELGTWVLRTRGDADAVLAHDRLLTEHAGDWFVNEVRLHLGRTLKRLDVTSRSLVALIEPGSCFTGPLLELALAADRSYMLDGLPEGEGQGRPAALVLGETSFGALPMGNGLSRLATRFVADQAHVDRLRVRIGEPLEAAAALELGLVTFAPDDLDWEDEVRLALEERASFSPDALTGMEANLRFAGPETVETKVFARLSAWQNWIFTRPNAAGPDGALRKYGTGQRASFDRRRA
jgi:benzoyl-CoA-dihydrodiol lyase